MFFLIFFVNTHCSTNNSYVSHFFNLSLTQTVFSLIPLPLLFLFYFKYILIFFNLPETKSIPPSLAFHKAVINTWES